MTQSFKLILFSILFINSMSLSMAATTLEPGSGTTTCTCPNGKTYNLAGAGREAQCQSDAPSCSTN